MAKRTGTYTFQAMAHGSRIDAVEAIYDLGGHRLGYNDDAASNTLNSRFTLRLQAGQSYVFGVTNHTGSPNGGYQVIIGARASSRRRPPPSARSTPWAAPTLTGTNLQLYLYGQNRTSFSYSDNYIQVQILDSSGRAIHTGYWQRGFRTSGQFIPGNPQAKSMTWNIDVSGFDLSRAYRFNLVVGHN